MQEKTLERIDKAIFLILALVGMFVGGRLVWSVTKSWTQTPVKEVWRAILIVISGAFGTGCGLALALVICLIFNELLRKK